MPATLRSGARHVCDSRDKRVTSGGGAWTGSQRDRAGDSLASRASLRGAGADRHAVRRARGDFLDVAQPEHPGPGASRVVLVAVAQLPAGVEAPGPEGPVASDRQAVPAGFPIPRADAGGFDCLYAPQAANPHGAFAVLPGPVAEFALLVASPGGDGPVLVAGRSWRLCQSPPVQSPWTTRIPSSARDGPRGRGRRPIPKRSRSALAARLCPPPAAMALTFVLGSRVWAGKNSRLAPAGPFPTAPKPLKPHPQTVPSCLSAIARPPAARDRLGIG